MRFQLRFIKALSFSLFLLAPNSILVAQQDSPFTIVTWPGNFSSNYDGGADRSYTKTLEFTQRSTALELFAAKPISQSTELDIVETKIDLHSDVTEELLGTTESLDLSAERFTANRPNGLAQRVWRDHLNFYSPQSFWLIGFGLGAGAIVANTKLDGDIQRHLQSSLHHANSDDWLEALHANKELGDGRYTLPIYVGVYALGNLLPDSDLGSGSRIWSERTIRGFLIGAPPVLLLQRVTGSSRPGEANNESEWEPFRDNNGVSGHAFMGALPFITAAKMSDSTVWKTTFYAASALAPLSRTSDGAHYPSQVVLGWWMAFVAASAVHATDDPNSRWRVLPLTTASGSGLGLEYRF